MIIACPTCGPLGKNGAAPIKIAFCVHPLITTDIRLILPLSNTLIPTNVPQSVPSRPLIVNPFILTSAPLLTSTIYGRSITLGSMSSSGGDSTIVDSEPEPIIVKFLLIVICSVYVPGNTFIVSPGFEAFIAACIVGKSVGTVISGLQNSTELTKKPSNGPFLHTYFLLLSEPFGG